MYVYIYVYTHIIFVLAAERLAQYKGPFERIDLEAGPGPASEATDRRYRTVFGVHCEQQKNEPSPKVSPLKNGNTIR